MLPVNVETVGILGEEEKEFQIIFSSVTKDIHSPLKYNISGYSAIDNITKSLYGSFYITEVVQICNKHSVDTVNCNIDESVKFYPATGNQKISLILGNCIFFENRFMNCSGFFEGHLKLTFYIKDGTVYLYADELKKETQNSSRIKGKWHLYTDDITKEFTIEMPTVNSQTILK